jgi:hypothetical protein
MDQAQVARDQEQAGVWEEVKVVAAVGEVVSRQVPAENASAQTVGKECHTNLGLPAMSRAVLSVERL